MQAFRGFGPQALPFFRALAFHQDRAWMEANRHLYESDVRAPLALLLDDLAARLSADGIPLKGDAKRSIFRLNRDVRFSKSKDPYKTHSGAVMTRSGAKGEQGLLYIHIDPAGCFLAAGFYMPEPAQLTEMRRDIVARAPAFRAACAGVEFSDGDSLTRSPRGFEPQQDPLLEAALRRRSHTFRQELAEAEIASPALVDIAAAFAARALPFLRFGWNAIDRVPPAPRVKPVKARVRA